MARYIDAEELYKRVKDNVGAYYASQVDVKDECLEEIENMPTADVAREIFEEIDEILRYHGITIGLVFDEANGANMAIGRIEKMISELKKKYMEGD